jgi:hypothetical protein
VPSLEAVRLDFRPEKRWFYAAALSGLATDLPSEKNPKPAGTVLKTRKIPGFIALLSHSGTEMPLPAAGRA